MLILKAPSEEQEEFREYNPDDARLALLRRAISSSKSSRSND